MPVAVLDRPASPAAAGRGTAAMLWAVTLVAAFFFVVVALPYFLSSGYNADTYAGRRGWLLVHIAGGAVALFTGPVQLWLGLADRRVEVHRRLGAIYMAAVLLSSAAAYYLSTHHPSAGFVFGAGLAGLATAWLTTTGMAFVAIKRYLIDQHKEWMIRSYVVTFGFVLFRVADPLVMKAGMADARDAAALCAWACWTIPLLATELWIQGRKILTAATT